MASQWESKRVLVTVRTYPTPAKKGVEVSCTAGVTEDGKWIRLFPLPYRSLDSVQQFKKYEWIEVKVKKASDARPESFNPDLDSIKVVSSQLPTDGAWRLRKSLVNPLRAHCMCCLRRERDEHGAPTLGFFRPHRVKRLLIEPTEERDWSAEQYAKLRQLELQPSFLRTAPAVELEKVPYDFSYEFSCPHDDCRGHTMMCTDWEMGESYRSWGRDTKPEWRAVFRKTYEDRMLASDLHFYVGTVHQYPDAWIIVGLFYPPESEGEQPLLFDH